MKDRSSGKRYSKLSPSPSEGGSPYRKMEDCSGQAVSTQLQKVTSAISTLVPGEVLSIELTGSVLSANNSAGDICGYIVDPKNKNLIDCIKKGYSFKATVTKVSGLVCQVYVEIDK